MPPPHDYDIARRAFVRDGVYLSRRELKPKIDRLTAFVQREAAKIAERYKAGQISVVDFEIAMRELLKSAHIVAATVGRGGRGLMAAADWGRVGRKIQWQYGYLGKFTRKLAEGRLDKAFSVGRARSYASSIYISYAQSLMATEKEFIADGGDTNPAREMLCRLVQNSEEGCAECTADADAGWMPVSEMGELGTRICGDFCKCLIEFEDEV